jgi:hypothetical protein
MEQNVEKAKKILEKTMKEIEKLGFVLTTMPVIRPDGSIGSNFNLVKKQDEKAPEKTT